MTLYIRSIQDNFVCNYYHEEKGKRGSRDCRFPDAEKGKTGRTHL